MCFPAGIYLCSCLTPICCSSRTQGDDHDGVSDAAAEHSGDDEASPVKKATRKRKRKSTFAQVGGGVLCVFRVQ
jgi:hypothetical protein